MFSRQTVACALFCGSYEKAVHAGSFAYLQLQGARASVSNFQVVAQLKDRPEEAL